MTDMRERARRALVPFLIFVVTALVYVITLGDRRSSPSPDNHFVHLAESFLHGQLGVLGNTAPGTNDWALFEGRWYVSFPPFPALVIAPLVAIWHMATLDRLFWALLAGVAPALIFVVLRALNERGHTKRSLLDQLLLTTLFAFGSVYFFTAVQGAVWFAAQIVASILLALYLLFSLDAKRPVLAGLMMGLLFVTRPTTALGAIFFGIEALRMARAADAKVAGEDASMWTRAWVWLSGVNVRVAAKQIALFSGPILIIVGVAMWFNEARFHSPLEFGHRYLQIRWSSRIERWGLFNYHFMSKNMAVFFAALPWLSAVSPYIKISRHGLALWFTTPNLLTALWPKRVNATMVGLFLATALVAALNLAYQNSGWVQFGYRFALDYMPFLIVLLAMSGRRFGWGFWAFAIFAIAVNTFGAVTFDRVWEFYDGDASQDVIFQPDL
ncbi:MAG: hypothetical protein IPK60_15035 [Sandaracinaceae bacterium]|nr:hypothetical protein [Sandaracinaceae bacterium]